MWVIFIGAFMMFVLIAIVLVWIIHKVNNAIAREDKKLEIELETMEKVITNKRNLKKER